MFARGGVGGERIRGLGLTNPVGYYMSLYAPVLFSLYFSALSG